MAASCARKTIFHYPGLPPRIDKSDDGELTAACNKIFSETGAYREHPETKKFVASMHPEKVGPYLYPTASKQHCKEMTEFYVTYFVYDDVMEGSGEYEIPKVVLASHGDLPMPDKEPRSLLRAINKMGRCFAPMPISWKARYDAGIKLYCESLSKEAELLNEMRATGIHPTTERYLTWRWRNAAGHVVLIAGELCMGGLSDHWATNKLVQQFGDQWNNVFISQNDYVGAKSGRDKGMLNLAWALARDYGMDQDQACSAVMDIHDKAVAAIKNIYKALAKESNNDSVLMSYLDIGVNCMLGFAKFYEDSVRYKF